MNMYGMPGVGMPGTINGVPGMMPGAMIPGFPNGMGTFGGVPGGVTGGEHLFT